jgi:hypothetical protein
MIGGQAPAQEAMRPAVDPRSAADPRADMFSPEPGGDGIVRTERLTGEQLRQMGVPVQTISDTQKSSGPVSPSPETTKQRPPTTVLTGGTPVAGVPWSTQSNIPVDLQSSRDPYAPSFSEQPAPPTSSVPRLPPAHEAPPVVGSVSFPGRGSEARSVQDFDPGIPVNRGTITKEEAERFLNPNNRAS